jgi:YHS domain-containing protein
VIRFALALALVFLFLGLLRVARFLLAAPRAARRSSRHAVESEMVRDPVCGTWIDRRLAVSGRRGGEAVAVCSEKCLRALESG